MNPPTEPAQPVTSPDAAPAIPPNTAVTAPARAGMGPESFVGRWSAQPAWCADPQGAQAPITITPIRFEGYENSCHIFSIDQTTNGYQAALRCISEGEPRNERVQMTVANDAMTLTYLDRGPSAQVKLLKCTTLNEVGPNQAGLPLPK